MIQNETTEPEVVAVPSVGNSDRNLASSIGKNTIFGVMSKIAQIATRLLTVPIVISHLGLDGYGIWAIIGTAAMAVLSVAGLIPTAIFSRQLAHWMGVPPQFLSSASGAISMLAAIMT